MGTASRISIVFVMFFSFCWQKVKKKCMGLGDIKKIKD